MTTSVRDVSETWFGGWRYAPRVEIGDDSRWFALTDAITRASEVPAVPPRAIDGAALSGAIRATYESWSISPRSRAAERIAQLGEGAACVVTGQQPGFLGGPLLTLYKALTTIAAAAHYERTTGRACVPVFWVAGDDHDLDEVRTARFPGGQAGELEFEFLGESDRRPIADYPWSSAASAEVERARERCAHRRFAASAAPIFAAYTGRGLAAAFGAALDAVLGDRGLVVIDPVRLRPLGAELIARVLENAETVLEAVAEGRDCAAARGVPAQVAARFPLFFLTDGKRHHLSPAPGGLQLDGLGEALSTEAALAQLRRDPTRFSPGALLRPLFQEWTLPSVLTIGGPAELRYFAQLGPLASALGVEHPKIALRAGATILDGAAARTAASLDATSLAHAHAAHELVATGADAPGIEAVRTLAAEAERALANVLAPLPQKAAAVRKLRGRATALPDDLRRWADRATQIWAESQALEFARAEKLWNHVFPAGTLQERRWAWLHFVAKHGTGWIDAILEELRNEPLRPRHLFVEIGA